MPEKKDPRIRGMCQLSSWLNVPMQNVIVCFTLIAFGADRDIVHKYGEKLIAI